MNALRDFLTPDDVRQVHLRIFDDYGEEYLRNGPFGDETREKVRQRILNVKGRRIRRVIDPVGSFTLDRVRECWAHYMAMICGTHPWPDANHRTGMSSYQVAVHNAFGVFVSLTPNDGRELVRRSKAIRQPFVEKNLRYFTVHELSDEQHAYRAVYRDFEHKLAVEPVA